MFVSRELARIQARVHVIGARLDCLLVEQVTARSPQVRRKIEHDKHACMVAIAREIEKTNRLLESIPCEAD